MGRFLSANCFAYPGIAPLGSRLIPLALRNLVADNEEILQVGDSERRRQSNVGGVAPDSHENATDARRVVAGVEGPQAAGKIDFEPGGKVHRRRRKRDTNVAEVSGSVAGGNVERAAEGDGQMLVIAADALPFGEDVEGGFRRPGILVSEDNLLVNPVADSLNARPARQEMSKEV